MTHDQKGLLKLQEDLVHGPSAAVSVIHLQGKRGQLEDGGECCKARRNNGGKGGWGPDDTNLCENKQGTWTKVITKCYQWSFKG